LHRTKFTLEEALTLLQARHLGSHHFEEITNFGLVEPATSCGKRS
jgi:hypothetical protein